MLCTPMVWYVLITIKMKQSEESHYYQILDIYRGSEARKFPQNAVFQQSCASLHTTGALIFILEEVFLSPRLKDMVQKVGLEDHPTNP